MASIGPGLDAVGPMGNLGGYSPISKLILFADMLAGRPEIVSLLALSAPSMWRR